MSRCKTVKRLIPATCAWVLLLSATAVFFIFPCRRLHEEFHFSITIAQAIIAFFVIANLFATTFVDPGIIRRADPDEDKDDRVFKEVQINNHVVRMKWCPTCKFYRPPRCSHCSVCDHCIERFDHHCPWVNNCIGRRNYRHFFFFLIFLTLHVITIFIWCLLLVINNRKNLHETAVVAAIVLIVIISIFFIPIFGLTGFHIILVARGRTTNEQVTKKFDNQVNPFTDGIISNCIYTLCGPRYPGLYKPKNNSQKESDIRIYMDNKPEDEEKIEEINFSLVDNPKDILLERLDGSIYKNKNESSSQEPLKNINSEETMFNLNGLKSEDNHVVTMHHMENGTKETTFIALPPNSLKSLNDKPNLFHYNKISASKSTSINEISFNRKSSRIKNDTMQQGPEGGMLIYYSPDAGYISNTNKFNSESELQKFKNSQFLYIDDEPFDSNDKYYKPMPFQKALEISNKIEQNIQTSNKNENTPKHTNRQSQYEMNYEISV